MKKLDEFFKFMGQCLVWFIVAALRVAMGVVALIIVVDCPLAGLLMTAGAFLWLMDC